MFILARSTLASAGMKGYGIPLKFFQVEETEIWNNNLILKINITLKCTGLINFNSILHYL